jgi:hypothetical protein
MFDVERRLVDVTHTEAVEAGLDAFIAKRDKQRRQSEGERAREVLYSEGCRRYEEKERRRVLWEWLRFHEAQIRRHTATLEALISRHRREAERYAELLGVEEVIDESTNGNGYANGHKKGAVS